MRFACVTENRHLTAVILRVQSLGRSDASRRMRDKFVSFGIEFLHFPPLLAFVLSRWCEEIRGIWGRSLEASWKPLDRGASYRFVTG